MTKEEATAKYVTMQTGYRKFFATEAGKYFLEYLDSLEYGKLEFALKSLDNDVRIAALDQARGIRTVREHVDALVREPRP